MPVDQTKIQQILSSISHSPGVYQMLDKNREIIYIGKAKNLKKRVRSYFQKSKNHAIKTKKMVEKIDDISCIETNSELEALVLETNMIKEHRPKYNILMKDDKNYVYIKITNEDFPQIYTVRKRLNDKAKYFGPKTRTTAVRETLKLVNKLFPYRSCTLDIRENKDKNDVVVKGAGQQKLPCLDYHIKRCCGPCIYAVNKQEYQELIDQVVLFLQGKHKPIIEKLQQSMAEAAQNRNFEKAAQVRDMIQNIESIMQKQLATDVNIVNQDVIAFVQKEEKVFLNLFQIREGKIINQENFQLVADNNDNNSAILETFLQNYYLESSDIPDQILLPDEIENRDIYEKLISQQANHSIKILVPQRGQKNKLIELCQKNAQLFAKKMQVSWQSERKTTDMKEILSNLQKNLDLSNFPKRIECYDISHLQGTDTVGSMVVFENGIPKKDHYRRFKIQKLKEGEIDDFKSLAEVLERRLKKINNNQSNILLKKGKKNDLKIIEKFLQEEKLDHENLQGKDFVIAEIDGVISGFGRIKKLAQDEETFLELSGLWVQPDHRGKKVGFEIMKELFKKQKGKDIFISIDKSLQNYYETFGFKEIKKNIPKIVQEKSENFFTLHKRNIKDVRYLKFKIPKQESFEKLPDLIVIDGGKGQLSSVEKVVHSLGIKTDLISLAKKEEEIFKPQTSMPILLERNSEELYLIQRIRDEAHRFAISYNKNLRSKKISKSALDSIKGIGPKTKKALIEKFGSVKEIKKASPSEIIEICGEKIAKKLIESLGN